MSDADHSRQIEVIRSNGYRFQDLRSPDDVLLREHVGDFVLHHAEDSSQSGPFAQAFHALVDGQGRGTNLYAPSETPHVRIQSREPLPSPYATVINRGKAGFEKYSGKRLGDTNARILSGYGVVIGGILACRNSIIWENHGRNMTQDSLEEMFRMLSRIVRL